MFAWARVDTSLKSIQTNPPPPPPSSGYDLKPHTLVTQPAIMDQADPLFGLSYKVCDLETTAHVILVSN